ncbi:MAG: radical SAM protein [Fuerstiella sp.]|nr:radical SAM protein [Fuerstiella sp.]MCP4855075.1 radical SAM protein [Fuerstiella sp.]
MYPIPDPAMPEFISNHGVRMVEATLRASELDGLDVVVFDLHDAAADDLTQTLIDIDPDIVGFSCYLWSFPLFAEVAERLANDDPARMLLFGGPSAQPSMLDQAPFHTTRAAIDALIVGEGELTFLELVTRQHRQPRNIADVRGIAQWDGAEWHQTPKRPLADLNELPSPYVMQLVPPGGLGVLQTYRGCPYTCSFCEWGTMESPKRVRTADHLAQEFDAMDSLGVDGALLVDAGLNLNSKAFEQLDKAAQQTDFFRHRKLISEVYPAKIQDPHIRFLERIGNPLVGIGLQSFDNDVLANVERSFEESRFITNVQQLTEVARVAIEIIMGLPGDSPEQFRESFHRARSFPCALRVYHCCVLPSALMVRSPPEHALNYDPVSLKIRSCLGWSEDDVRRECDFLNAEAHGNTGQIGDYFWVFSAPQNPAIQPRRSTAA